MKGLLAILTIYILLPFSIAHAQLDTMLTINSGISVDLNAIALRDSANGFIVGCNGMILHSGNKGASWKKIKTPTKACLQTIEFVDNKCAYVVGDSGTILRTSDGGKSWKKLPFVNKTNLTCGWFPDSLYGYVGSPSNRWVWKTTDGGRTWSAIPINKSGTLHLVLWRREN